MFPIIFPAIFFIKSRIDTSGPIIKILNSIYHSKANKRTPVIVNPNFSFFDLVEFLDKNKEITAINQQYLGINWYRNHLDELKNVKKSWTASNV